MPNQVYLPETHTLIISNIIANQKFGLEKDVELAFKQLDTYLAQHNFTKSNITLTRLYVSDMTQYAQINALYSQYFQQDSPARICVELPLHESVIFNLEIIASQTKSQTIHIESVSSWAPAMIGPYSQQVETENYLAFAGMIGLIPSSMKMEASISGQMNLAENHIQAIFDYGLKEGRSQRRNLFNDEPFSEKYQNRLSLLWNRDPTSTPKNSTDLEIKCRNLPKNANIEIEDFALLNSEKPTIHQFGSISDLVRFLSLDRTKNSENKNKNGNFFRCFVPNHLDITDLVNFMFPKSSIQVHDSSCISYLPCLNQSDILVVAYRF